MVHRSLRSVRKGGIGRETVKVLVVVLFAFALTVAATGTAAAQTDISGCTDINSAGNYEITQDIEGTGICVDVAAGDVSIDGNGNTINGTDAGVSALSPGQTITNVTVENLTVTNSTAGISVLDAEEINVADVETLSTGKGMFFDNVTDMNVTDVKVSQTNVGVEVNRSEDVTVRDSLVTSEGLPSPLGSDSSDSVDPLLETRSHAGDETDILVNDGFGIALENTEESVVKDNVVRSFDISGIDVSMVSDGGLPTLSAGSNKVVGNEVTDSGDGISISTELSSGGTGLIDVTDASSNEVVNNSVEDNDVGISISTEMSGIPGPGPGPIGVTDASSNEVVNNDVEDNDIGVFVDMTSFDGIQPVSNGAPSNRIAENDLVDNGDGIIAEGITGVGISNNTVLNSTEDGIEISREAESENNELKDNFVNDSGRYGIWISSFSRSNELTDNVAENNTEAGIYVGGVAGPSQPVLTENTLVNNTARGSEYGIWIRNVRGNEVSESLAENNEEGITVERSSNLIIDGTGTESVGESLNNFTEDVSRNNDWDFVVETEDINGINPYSTASSGYPVTNLSIGESTAPDTMLSFDADDVRLGSIDDPAEDPDDLENASRYFEAEQLSGEAFLNFSLSYEDDDASGINESTLGLRQLVGTQWVDVPGSSLNTTNNLVSANLTGFGARDFGAFGEPAEDGDGGFDLDDYRNQNGNVDTGGLQQAINDFVQGNIDTGDLQAVINAFVQSGSGN